MWISDGLDAPHIIAHFARKGIPLKSSTLDSLLRRYRREDRTSLITHHIVRHPKYSYEAYKAMANIQKRDNKLTYDQIAAEWRLWWSRQHNGSEDGPTPSHYTINKALKMFSLSTKNLEWVAVLEH